MSSYLLPYSLGLASVTNGSKVVTGTLTAWTGNAKPGDMWQGPDGLLYAISAAPITNTRMELVNDYAGVTASGQPYQIHRLSSGWGETSDVNRRVSDLLASLKRLTLTSVSEVEIGMGAKIFSVQSGFPISAGARVTVANPTDPENYMAGTVIAYEGTSLTVDVLTTGGSGTFSDWNINFAGSPGPEGDPGDNGTNGWSPVFAVVTDGDRRVQQVQSWAGGTGTPPASGGYVGATGVVPDIADAVDIRGEPGLDGTGVGTVTQIDTGAGLTGGPITGSGTIDIDIAGLNEETEPDAADWFLMQRDSDGGFRKVAAENLPGSGGGFVPFASRAYVTQTAAVSIPSATQTVVPWNNEITDTGEFWTLGNPARLTVPAGISSVLLWGYLQLSAAGGSNSYIQVKHYNSSGVEVSGPYTFSVATSYGSVGTGPISVSAGDYFVMFLYQSAGSAVGLFTDGRNYFAIAAIVGDE